MVATDLKLKGSLGHNRWTLCLGAGASFGVVPKWNELTLRIVNKVFGTAYTQIEFDVFTSQMGWGLDGWIQAAANHYQFNGHDMAEFHTLLEDALYQDLRAKAIAVGIEDELFEALRWPRNVKRGSVKRICSFFETQYPNTSLMALVRWMSAAAKKKKLPYAIITFNVETLFHTVFELFQRRDHYQLPLAVHSHPQYLFTRVITPHPSPRETDFNEPKICIYHCHGTLIPRLPHQNVRPNQVGDGIVFLEQDYLRVSTQMATWSETLFMFHSKTTQMLFVGLSMSDPNIRRWLGLTKEFALRIRPTIQWNRLHYWITKKPDHTTDEILANGLAHLGVVPALINDWPDLEAGLNNITAV